MLAQWVQLVCGAEGCDTAAFTLHPCASVLSCCSLAEAMGRDAGPLLLQQARKHAGGILPLAKERRLLQGQLPGHCSVDSGSFLHHTSLQLAGAGWAVGAVGVYVCYQARTSGPGRQGVQVRESGFTHATRRTASQLMLGAVALCSVHSLCCVHVL